MERIGGRVMKEWNVRVIASVQYYQDYIVEAKTKKEAEKQMTGDLEKDDQSLNKKTVQAWNEYHEGDNLYLRIDPDRTENMEFC
jgi:hypothetical protein